MRQKQIAAVIVTYNRKELLEECIQAVMAQSLLPQAILVIDNSSTDGTQEYISAYIHEKQIEYYNTGENLGGAGGFSCGIRLAVKKEFDYIWIMDDDTIPKRDSLENLLDAAGQVSPGWGFLSSKAVWQDGSFCRMNEQKLYGQSIHTASGIVPCRQATFVSLLLSADAVEQLGLPIKEFFIWGDDVEYTRRLSADRPCYYVSDSVVLHKTANNVGSNIAKDEAARLPRYRYAYRNEVYIALQEGPSRIAYQIMKILYHIFRVLIVSPSDRLLRIQTILRSSCDGLSFHPEVEYVKRDHSVS